MATKQFDPTLYGATKFDPSQQGATKFDPIKLGATPYRKSVAELRSEVDVAEADAQKQSSPIGYAMNYVKAFRENAERPFKSLKEQNYVDTAKQSFGAGVSQMGQAIRESQGGRNPYETGVKFGSGALRTIVSPISPIFSPIGEGIDYASKQLDKSGAFDDIASSPGGDQASEGTGRLLEGIINTTDLMGVGLGGPKIKSVAEKVPETIKRTFTSTPEESLAAKRAADARQINTFKTEWERPIKSNVPSFNKARGAIEKDANSPKFLAELNIDPRVLIEDGRYNTLDVVDSLRSTALKLRQDTLQPALEVASYSVPKVLADELLPTASRYIKDTYGQTPKNAELIGAEVDSIIAALKRKYPDGMSLLEMDKEKINSDIAGGYRPFRSASDTNTDIANRAVGDALDSLLQEKVPSDVPYKDFKTYLAQYYKAAEFVKSLDQKTAPVTMGQFIGRNVAKFTGAGLGAGLGGGVVSAFAGYTIGKALEHSLENLTPKMRAVFFRNLEKSNPEAYKAVVEYVKTNKSVLQLPPPSSIITPTPSEESLMRGRANTINQERNLQQ